VSTLQEIEHAIEQLPASQRWDLFHRLQDRLWDDWDRQIEADQNEGRLDSLISEVKSDIAFGNLKTLDEVINDI